MKNMMSFACAAALGLALSLPALAEDQEKQVAPQLKTAGEAPAMSEIPKMKEQGERMAVLMEKLTKDTHPAERKRIMAEAICPQ